jgi:hypothetical protein
MVSFTPPICSDGWLSYRGEKMGDQLAACGRRRPGGEVIERLLKVAFVDQEVIGVVKGDVCADFPEYLQGARDVNLRLVLEESLITGLSETKCGIHYGFRERAVGNASI